MPRRRSLRREVGSFLPSYERAENFIESPAIEVAPELMTDDRPALGRKIDRSLPDRVTARRRRNGRSFSRAGRALGRKVALKLLPALDHGRSRTAPVQRGGPATSALNHPNILTVYEIGSEGNERFIATEFIKGVTLRALLETEEWICAPRWKLQCKLPRRWRPHTRPESFIATSSRRTSCCDPTDT